MKVKVGLVGIGQEVTRKEVIEGKLVEKTVFECDTATIYLDPLNDTTLENMHEGNYISVALAVARRRLGDTPVFPIDIEKSKYLKPKPAKKEK